MKGARWPLTVVCTVAAQLFLHAAHESVPDPTLVSTSAGTSSVSPEPAGAPALQRFLARGDRPHQYRAFRRLEAENAGSKRSAWLTAWTEFTPAAGLRYDVVEEGGSEYIRSRVLKAVLEAEREFIARGAGSRSAIATANYTFQPDGLDQVGHERMLLAPKRKDGLLVIGAMFLNPANGDLVRIEGRLAKSPSFWVKHVNVVRLYERVQGALLPVALESTAQMRLLGPSTFRMTYRYAVIDGRPVRSS